MEANAEVKTEENKPTEEVKLSESSNPPETKPTEEKKEEEKPKKILLDTPDNRTKSMIEFIICI